jgi:ankyrin repeat protein
MLLPSLAAAVDGPARRDVRLVDSAAHQDGVTVRALLKSGVDANSTQPDGATALLWAAHWADLDLVDVLLRAGARVDAADDHGVTPLSLACENASAALVEKLLKAGAKVDAAQTNGVTPLMIAARTGNAEVVKLLLVRSANVNAAIAETKQTPLMWATAERHLDTMRLLIDAGADVHAASKIGFTPLLFASRNGDIEAAKILLATGVKVNEAGSDGTHPLALAIVSGHDKMALFLLDQNADPNGQIFGVRALHAAAGDVQMWLREWLRGRRIDGVFGSPISGLTPSSRLAVVKALVARGADVNARITTSTGVQGWLTTKHGAFEPFSVGTGDLKGATPLWVAAFSANRGSFVPAADADTTMRSGRLSSGPEIVKALLEAGGDPKLTTEDGTTPLMVAAGLGQGTFTPGKPRGDRSTSAEEAVKVIVEAGSDVNAVNEAKFTALHGAAFRGLDEVIQYLVEHGANINAQDFMGRTAFRMAEGSKQTFQFQEWPETAEFIKKLGADTTLGVPGRVQERQREVATDGSKSPQH